ncbi:MAG: Bug family tripartite tricarboxylate transporter substrate binding protein [Beijerinckiaceae bacterium]
MKTRRTFLASSLVAAALAAGAAPASAFDLAGKTVSIIVPFPVGGGVDLWARFNAPLLAKHLPGKPTVIVRNVPGGGSTAGANLFTQTAKPDGLTLLASSASTQFPYLLGDPRVKYEYKDWRVVLAGPTGGVAYVTAKTGAKSIKDFDKLKGTQFFYASSGPTALELTSILAFRLLDLNVKHVFGIVGRAEALLGFERGEFTLDTQTTSAYLRRSDGLVKKGEAAPLFTWGVLDAKGELARDPNFPDIPHIQEAYEIVHGKKPSGIEWEAFKAFLISGFPAQKLLVLPKGTSDEILEAYRAAARQLLKDPDYLANRDKVIGEYEQVTDAEAEKLYLDGTSITPEAKAWVRDFLQKTHQVKFD